MIYPNDLVQEDIGPKSPASKRGKIPKAIYAGGNLGTFTTFYIISADTIGGETSGPKLVAQTERSPVPRENIVGYVPSGHYSPMVTILQKRTSIHSRHLSQGVVACGKLGGAIWK
jgi:hypothetical protein